jgi:purine-binding chemotaxis protein CheW
MRWEASTASRATVHLLRFRVSGAELAVVAREIEEIVELSVTTSVPGVSPHVPGLLAVRGEPLPLLDLAAFLGLPAEARAEDRDPRVLVARVLPFRVGVLADSITGITGVTEDQLVPPAILRPELLKQFARAELDMGDRVVAVLDLGRLLEAARA